MLPALSLQNTFLNVRGYGAIGDGQALETPALQATIDACHQQGGGTVFFPAGQYLTGTLFLRNHITLYLEAGATLLGSENPEDYPVTHNRWEGAEQATYAPLISGQNLTNIAVIGRGSIDGRGEVWWKRFEEETLEYPRPRLISFSDCDNVLIEGITLLNSPSWTINPVRCTNLNVRGVTIINPPDSPNTDGINPDSCRYVRISDCYISVGDDCITIKSGTEHERTERRAPCRDITITNCTLARGHGGVVIGSEMNGGVQNVVISNCVFVGTDRGIRLKSRRGRGGIIEDVRVTNLIMTDVLCPFTMNLYYGCGAWGNPLVSDKNPQPLDEGTPRIRGVHLSHITAREVKVAAGFVYGLAEMPVEDVSISDVSISISAEAEAGYPEMAEGLELMRQAGFFVRNARRIKLQNVEISGQMGPAFRLADVSGVTLHACGTSTPARGVPVVKLNNVTDAFIQACQAGAGTEVFLRLEGANTRQVTLAGNALSNASQPLQLAPEVPASAIQAETNE